MFSSCSDCCAPGGEESQNLQQQQQLLQQQQQTGQLHVTQTQLNVPANAHLHATSESVRSVTLEERTERERAVAISEQTERQWVAITAYQPVDTVVKTVEVPVVRTIETYVPKVVVEEKIVEVPKFVPEYVEKIVEVPEVKVVDKVVEVPRYEYQYKYVQKIETQENVIQRPKYETKYVEKIVEVPQVKEVVRYQDVEEVEEVIRYVPKGQVAAEEWEKLKEKHEQEVKVEKEAREAQFKAEQEYQQLIAEEQAAYEARHMGKAATTAAAVMPPAPRLEQVFKPKVVKTVEIQKHVPVSVDVPVPYMVPKPIVVPVQVPVLKFRDHFVPVPVRRRVVPRIRWTNEVYEVECIKEKPFLQVQDIIKPVPCDVEIKVHEFVEKAQPINPAELSQADVHAMWMRVNADLAEKRKEELGDKYPYVQHAKGTVFGEPGTKRADESEGGEVSDPEAREGVEPLVLHPGHPLNMTYLQNEWIKKETTATHEMYTPEWFEAHQKAMHNLAMQYPTQVQLSAEQAARLQQDTQTFGEAPWVEMDEHGMPKMKAQQREPLASCCPVCSASCGGSSSGSCCTCGNNN
ncbi:hypothetical protein Esti_003043 [Eimeria stiedai]